VSNLRILERNRDLPVSERTEPLRRSLRHASVPSYDQSGWRVKRGPRVLVVDDRDLLNSHDAWRVAARARGVVEPLRG
jgi:hypothetical protein